MQISTGTSTRFAPVKTLHDHGNHPPGHQHGGHAPLIPMDAVHVAHDVAMIGMNLPGHHHHSAPLPEMTICGPSASHNGHAGHSPSKPGPFDAFATSGAVNQGLTVLSAAAAAGATYHGVKLVQDGEYGHGANHLLQGAGLGTMTLAMATGSHGLHQASSVLMGAHGAVEAGLGVRDFLKAETTMDKAQAATTVVHGACLAAAQMTNNALFTIPLYLGMGAATLASIALSQSK